MSATTYEVQVHVSDLGDDFNYYVDHAFATLPDLDTVAALRDEAATAFERLYPDLIIGQTHVRVMRLDGADSDPRDRENAEAVQ